MSLFEPWHLAVLTVVLALLFAAVRIPESARPPGRPSRILRPTTARDLRRSAALFAGAALLLAGCSSGSGSSAASSPTTASTATTAVAPDTIIIKNFAFVPASLTVAPGTKVTVTNQDTVTHTVTATGAKAFDTGDITPGSTVTFTAPAAAGSYPYICSIHTYMQGTLTVS
jgi:plastocyanin